MRIVKRKNVFLTIYLFTMLCLFFASSDYAPFTSLLAKSKYIYMAYVGFDMMQHGFNMKKLSRTAIFILLVYFLYAIVFGIILVNPRVADYTAYQLNNVFLSLIMIFATYYEVELYDCFDDWCLFSLLAVSTLLTISFITHLGEVSKNPLFWITSLKGEIRTNATFGLEHWNLVGFFCFTGFVLTYFCFRKLKGKSYIIDNGYIRLGLICFCIVLTFMMGTVASRAATTALMLFVGLIILWEIYLRVLPSKRFSYVVLLALFICLVLILFYKFGFFSYIWQNSHRSLNIDKNMPIFYKYGNFWTGLGWVDNGALIDVIDAFGYGTSSLDMYYLYVYFTTGTIGCISMGIVYSLIGIKLLLSRNKERFIYISLYISLMYYMYWETILFTVKFWQGIIIVVILLHGMTVSKGLFFSNKNIR